ncbi:MAG: hypothetical protein HC875_30565 [Anaerolineales bacterium]|nr:hypothetical protein [Anaerolineales bacterium]
MTGQLKKQPLQKNMKETVHNEGFGPGINGDIHIKKFIPGRARAAHQKRAKQPKRPKKGHPRGDNQNSVFFL